MAINPNLKYPGRITAPTLNYPYGSSKNETSPGAGDGTPYELARADDLFGLQQALLRSASITPNGNSETAILSEYMQSIVEIAAGRAVNYDESGVVNVYVLDLQANQQGPRSYFDGLECKFFPGVTNTGPATADVNGLGALNIKLPGGVTDPAAGALATGSETTLIYRSSPSAHLELQTVIVGGFATGSITFPAVAHLGAAENMTISHGLGTDDVDFGFSISGDGGSIIQSAQVQGAMIDVTKKWVSNISINMSAFFPILNGATPSTGDVGILVGNFSGSAQDITCKWWVRAR